MLLPKEAADWRSGSGCRNNAADLALTTPQSHQALAFKVPWTLPFSRAPSPPLQCTDRGTFNGATCFFLGNRTKTYEDYNFAWWLGESL